MLPSRRHRMRTKLYQSSRAIATLTPSSNQKGFAAREWKRKRAARTVMTTTNVSSSAHKAGGQERGIVEEVDVVFPLCTFVSFVVNALPPQNSFSARLKFPSDPRFASAKVKRYWFSLRTEPRAKRRNSMLIPQQSQLYVACTAAYCRNPSFASNPILVAA